MILKTKIGVFMGFFAILGFDTTL